MSIKQFNFPTVIRFGENAVKEAPMHLTNNNCSNVLIVTDPVLATMDMISDLQNHLSESGIKASVFSDIAANPCEADVINGVKAFHQNNCDSIIGIGGGAAMDTARAVLLMANHPGSVMDYEDGTGADETVEDSKIPYFIAIPTTSGTGSEVGRSAIISDDKTHQKKVIFAPQLLAKIILADPLLTVALPKHITAATGVDALVHNVEAYLVNSFHPMCDGIALEGIRLIDESLVTAVNEPTNVKARTQMLIASTMGAVAFQKGLGVVHSCAHALSAFNNMHHGLANALMFAESLKFNKEVCADKYSRLEKLLGVDCFVKYVEDLNEAVGIKKGLSNYGVTAIDIDQIADIALTDTCHLSNPRKVSKDDLVNILKASL
ncbi:iron-containing alcohol dehydrogenase [Francisella sp. Scap27]|uniref:iron-containing alcohol dehydrogenase n=1 Tax=Francisella sp. Scap27 TaxID=2589986 RepID=UPI0015BAC685|nr:iron-containing alcohol dehydrogenase [Francisella sp. Scap27]QLE79771.1 iron-containing alcohol dehydrogenase [Francisella sp. Scap27]